MFQYFMISIVIAPVLLGIMAANGRSRVQDHASFRVLWIVYAILWFCTLYYLRYRWR